MTCGHGQNFWQRLMSEGKQSSKVFRPLTHPGRESLCHMGRQHAHASTPKGFEPLRAEPNGFLVHLLSHSDTVSSAGDLHWLLRHSQSTFVHQPRRLMMSEVQPYCQFGSSGSHGFHCSRVEHIPAPPAQGLWRNGSASDSRSEGWEFESLWPHLFPFCSLYVHTH